MTFYQKFNIWCIERHDVFCNQKYDTKFPYSMHLYFVVSQAKRFKDLLHPQELEIAISGCYGHDLIEDARATYNDIMNMVGKEVADIIYACTEDKGRNRTERHSEKYYKELANNRLAIFVKLCDILANVQYSILTNSSMYNKHKLEHEKTVKFLSAQGADFKPMFQALDKLFSES